MDNKIKHLEFIENVITRMNSNSFLIKGWVITLVSALFALAAKDSNRLYALVVYVPLPMFWLMDGFFLSMERRYRSLYRFVSTLEENEINFDMATGKYNKGKNTWLCSMFSKTLIPFYGFLFFISLIVMFIISK